MLITVKTSKEVWTSPDGQRNIWEIETPEGITWQTMSRQIAQAIGQTLDLTTRVSGSGKTYLVKPPQEGYGNRPAPAVDGLRIADGPSLESVLDRLISALEKLETALSSTDAHLTTHEETGLPPIDSYEEVLDDL